MFIYTYEIFFCVGRVETQIKQPREAELLGHDQKTWRHLELIQQKMTEIQKKFLLEVSASVKVSMYKYI
jgi:hypothetical protein